jgi:hypothetical protein
MNDTPTPTPTPHRRPTRSGNLYHLDLSAAEEAAIDELYREIEAAGGPDEYDRLHGITGTYPHLGRQEP